MRKNRGQGMIDYTILVALVLAALLVIGYYIRNSLSGKMREAADVYGQGEVYQP